MIRCLIQAEAPSHFLDIKSNKGPRVTLTIIINNILKWLNEHIMSYTEQFFQALTENV